MADSLCAQPDSDGTASVELIPDAVAVMEAPKDKDSDSVKSAALLFFNANSELCSNLCRDDKKPPAEGQLSDLCKTVCDEAEENENLRKKRCADRYDSSESSDSGVATLSCSDSSGSSSSELTDPGSPLSSSSSCECSDSPTPTPTPTPSKMPPNSAFPWNKRPSTEEALLASFHLKRSKLDPEEDADSLLGDNNNTKNGALECCLVRKALFGTPEKAPQEPQKRDLHLSTLSEAASNGGAHQELPVSCRQIPAELLSKTLVVKCENLSSLTQAQMPVKCRLLEEPKVTFRVPSVQTRRKLRSSRPAPAASEPSTNPFAFSRNFPGAYLLSPTCVNGRVVTQLPEIPLVPGGLSRFLSPESIKKPPPEGDTYLTLRGVVSVPTATPTATDETPPRPPTPEEEQPRLPLSCYGNEDSRPDSLSSSSLDFSDSSNSCQDSPAPPAKNIRFPRKEDKTADERYFHEEVPCRWKGCNQEFTSNAALVEHLQTKHVKEQTSGDVSSCLWEGCKCYGKPATNKGYLENHVITHAGKKPFSCIFQRCGLSFSSQGALARHVTQHFADNDGNNAAKRTPDSPQCKPNKRKVRKLRCRKRPQSRVTDFFDSTALERLNEKFATDTLRRTQGIFNENDNGFSITLLSQVCAKRTEPNGTVRYLLRWFPRGIVEEEWQTVDKVRGHRFVDMRTLAEEERQTCLRYIFQGSSTPSKSSRKLYRSHQNCS
ncbi:unnamed protein product [Bemisia tabaci]|uniref:C2H2-type domain-containing protein n=1 Tax=Bemisia tabaci TaxID=7038 RepID=A0A9P0G670_BEMTA|nr:unnamed protein product [Bemisia tabaci]